MDASKLVATARDARARAYAPYSGYAVGAALLAEDGRVFTGVNVENASYGLTVCAERSAVFAAIAAGCRTFSAIAVATEDGASCCGACRQVLVEFGGGTVVHLAAQSGEWKTTTVAELLPGAFRPKE